MDKAAFKASFILPAPEAEWAGQLFNAWFPEGVVLTKASQSGYEKVSGWLKKSGQREIESLKAQVAEAGGQRFFIKRQKVPDWQARFKSRFPVQHIGRFVIVPSWKKGRRKSSSLAIVLNPGQAFGTGLHPSTRLMLGFLQAHAAELPEGTVLDIGAGSGILGFGALKLGAKKVIANEMEAAACRQMAENRGLNRVAPSAFKIVCGCFPQAGNLAAARADVVLANIVTPVLLKLLPQLKACVKKGGWLALSGIHQKKEADQLAAALRRLGFKKVFRNSKGAWWCLSAKK